MRWQVVALAVALTVSGCASSDDSGEVVRTGRTPTSVGPDETLTAVPDPITLADLYDYPRSSSERAVTELVFWTQWGGIPNVIQSYDRRVTQTLSAEKLRKTYEFIRPQFVDALPRILYVCHPGDFAFLGLKLLYNDHQPQEHAFALAKDKGEWRIISDTILGQGPYGIRSISAAARRISKSIDFTALDARASARGSNPRCRIPSQ